MPPTDTSIVTNNTKTNIHYTPATVLTAPGLISISGISL